MNSKAEKKLSDYEISVFCRQMAMLIKAGIAPLEGIEIMLQDFKFEGDDSTLKTISQILSSGERFHVALQMTGAFPSYVIHMVTIGEESGNLDLVMDSLADYYEQEDTIRTNISSAISYPLIMIGMMIVVIIVLITQVLPIFGQVFAQLGTSMNSFSRSLLAVGSALNRYSIVFIAIMVIFAAGCIFFVKTKKGHDIFRTIGMHIPPIRKIYGEIATARFANGMVLTLSSGMDTYEGLRLVSKLVEYKDMVVKIETCRSLIAAGDSFPEAVKEAGIFNKFYSRMVAIGFQSGSMDTVMQQIARKYTDETQRKMYNFISILEPTLVIILSLIVGLILLSVILPLMGIMSSIG
ncbi:MULTISPECIES: type II secretion system F family protein [unclassified Butyrivibrio]|uniref:type II secretion system F family protein n=1 Tax=unclassified Butyrivibrio TaxID=2639466 RepID=UPI0003B4FE20|nr:MULTISPECIES: type II secretion system F family protein [unclassified Butyrivibrio]SEM07546.1 type IV pilus assembly protein PilC [Butyrivibrio sp. ob235]